jgi:hypothetical protein
MRIAWLLLLIVAAACDSPSSESARVPATDDRVESAPLASVSEVPPSQASEVATGVFVVTLKNAAGESVEKLSAGQVLLVLTAYGTKKGEIVASVEEFDWSAAKPWWRAALAGAKIGDERRVWFCGVEARREWGDWASRSCIPLDVEVVRNEVRKPGA